MGEKSKSEGFLEIATATIEHEVPSLETVLGEFGVAPGGPFVVVAIGGDKFYSDTTHSGAYGRLGVGETAPAGAGSVLVGFEDDGPNLGIGPVEESANFEPKSGHYGGVSTREPDVFEMSLVDGVDPGAKDVFSEGGMNSELAIDTNPENSNKGLEGGYSAKGVANDPEGLAVHDTNSAPGVSQPESEQGTNRKSEGAGSGTELPKKYNDVELSYSEIRYVLKEGKWIYNHKDEESGNVEQFTLEFHGGQEALIEGLLESGGGSSEIEEVMMIDADGVKQISFQVITLIWNDNGEHVLVFKAASASITPKEKDEEESEERAPDRVNERLNADQNPTANPPSDSEKREEGKEKEKEDTSKDRKELPGQQGEEPDDTQQGPSGGFPRVDSSIPLSGKDGVRYGGGGAKKRNFGPDVSNLPKDNKPTGFAAGAETFGNGVSLVPAADGASRRVSPGEPKGIDGGGGKLEAGLTLGGEAQVDKTVTADNYTKGDQGVRGASSRETVAPVETSQENTIADKVTHHSPDATVSSGGQVKNDKAYKERKDHTAKSKPKVSQVEYVVSSKEAAKSTLGDEVAPLKEIKPKVESFIKPLDLSSEQGEGDKVQREVRPISSASDREQGEKSMRSDIEDSTTPRESQEYYDKRFSSIIEKEFGDRFEAMAIERQSINESNHQSVALRRERGAEMASTVEKPGWFAGLDVLGRLGMPQKQLPVSQAAEGDIVVIFNPSTVARRGRERFSKAVGARA